eukprot:TRINITY_DN470_c0_g1_i3.p1 TRINITY_DN470_c0_g1~~TRINITY_DN470_c0_g1_i3.p1  ORF type:complete len:247 (+),score=9.50 TRINITY_DN470_c0_g1_i3:394-1134(+)
MSQIRGSVQSARYFVFWCVSTFLFVFSGCFVAVGVGLSWDRTLVGAAVLVAVLALFAQVMSLCNGDQPGGLFDIQRPTVFVLDEQEGLLVSRPWPCNCVWDTPVAYPLDEIDTIMVYRQQFYYRHLMGNSGGVLTSRGEPEISLCPLDVAQLDPNNTCSFLLMCMACTDSATCMFIGARLRAKVNGRQGELIRLTRQVWKPDAARSLYGLAERCHVLLEARRSTASMPEPMADESYRDEGYISSES